MNKKDCKRRRFNARQKRSRQGAVMILVAVSLMVILIIGGAAFEYSRLSLAEAELQAAADNIARSSCTELLLTDSTERAIKKGREVAQKFTVHGNRFSLRARDIEFGFFDKGSFFPNQKPLNAVAVTADRSASSSSGPMRLVFGTMFGVPFASGKRTATTSFRAVDMCFVLDRSSSMKANRDSFDASLSSGTIRFNSPPFDDTRWFDLHNAYMNFISRLDGNSGTQIGVVTFAASEPGLTDDPTSTIEFSLTRDLKIAKQTMSRLSSSVWNGNTNIEAGMIDGIRVLTSEAKAREFSEKIMVVLTDGNENAGSCISAAKNAAKKGIRIHTISFGRFANQDAMRAVAEIGKGSYAHADDGAVLEKIFLDLLANMTELVE